MTERTLRELIEQAEADLDRFKHPNVTEVQEKLHEILMAGKVGGIAHDKLESLYFSHGELHIRTSYSVRSCSMRGEYDIPETIIDADDPVRAMKLWSARKKVADAQSEYDEAALTAKQRMEALIKADADLHAVEDAELLADANSHYSAAQLEEIARQSEVRCIECGQIHPKGERENCMFCGGNLVSIASAA